MLDGILKDTKHTFRSLARSPGFAAVAILTLALGIGINTAVFSIVQGVLLSELPYERPDRLVALGEGDPGGDPADVSTTTPGSFFDWREGSVPAFDGMAAYSTGRLTLAGRDEPVQLRVAGGIGDLLGVLGVRPMLGRTFGPADESPDAPPVAVLAYETWRRLFGADPEIVGRTVNLDGVARTVIGVMPHGFRFPDATIDLWVPWRLDAEFRGNRDQYFLQVVGRLRPGVSIERAGTVMATVAARLRAEHPIYNTDLNISVLPLRDTIVAGVETQLWMLMGAVVFVLLIACANLGNLMLARASRRSREIAVRRALGAGRARLIRQLLTESTVLALIGGAAGVLLGHQLIGVLRTLPFAQPGVLPRAGDIGLDSSVLIFALSVCVLCGLAFGTMPALRLSRSGSALALRAGDRGGTDRSWTRRGLVVAEVALAVVLLAGAGLLLRSFAELRRVHPGVHTENVLTFEFQRDLPPSDAAWEARLDENRRFFEATLERIERVPGVRSAAIVSQLPLTGRGVGAWFNIYSRPLPEDEKPPSVPYRVVTPDYFRTVGLPLVRGRLITSEDTRAMDSPGVVINETLARLFWPDGDPIGEEIYLGAPDNRIFPRATIVGIVGDTRDLGPATDPLPTVYVPHAVAPHWRWFGYVVRAEVEAAAIAGPVRRAIRELDRETPIERIRPMASVVNESVASPRWWTILLGTFAGLALVLAALGIFGVLSYVIGQRARELGIRMAMGASAERLRAMVLREGLALCLLGAAIGVAAGLALTRLMSGMLYGIDHTDPITYAAVIGLLIVMGGLASYLPARRATRVDPMVVLRQE